MTKDEALKLALEALDCICSPLYVREITKVGNAMKAIKEVLAQPEQEPVAWRSWNDKDKFGFWDTKSEAESWCDLDFDSEPLYTTPPPQREWVGLTEEEIDRLNFLLVEGCQCSFGYVDNVEEFAQSIEAKLREKNGC